RVAAGDELAVAGVEGEAQAEVVAPPFQVGGERFGVTAVGGGLAHDEVLRAAGAERRRRRLEHGRPQDEEEERDGEELGEGDQVDAEDETAGLHSPSPAAST